MSEESPAPPATGHTARLIGLAAAGVLAIGIAITVGLREWADQVAPPELAAAAGGRAGSGTVSGSGPGNSLGSSPGSSPGAAAGPTFDLVRVNPRGDTVMAGHAAPGAQVRITDGGRVIGEVTAEPDGAWVFVPSEPLPAGGRSLALTERLADGKEIAGTGDVLLVVPDGTAAAAGGGGRTPLAVLSTEGAAPRVLQAPQSSPLGIDAAEFDARGAARLAGHAPPGSTVRVTIDGDPRGEARADAQGRWSLAAPGALALGEHRLRLDQLDGSGRVTARAEAPLPRAPDQAGAGRLVVAPGQTLWRLARTVYGSGARYTLLYDANRSQISDPARIFPGQVFQAPAR